jgi:thioredoxin
MNALEFQKLLLDSPKPLIVELWAPWCGPCRAMAPAFLQIGQKFAGRVDVLKINADEEPEVIKFLGVMGIPTMIGFANGQEIVRRTGLQSQEALEILFGATLQQNRAVITPPAPLDRWIRSGAGLALIAVGWFWGQSVLLASLGGVLLFSAFYDRCPIFRALAPRISALFQRSH